MNYELLKRGVSFLFLDQKFGWMLQACVGQRMLVLHGTGRKEKKAGRGGFLLCV